MIVFDRVPPEPKPSAPAKPGWLQRIFGRPPAEAPPPSRPGQSRPIFERSIRQAVRARFGAAAIPPGAVGLIARTGWPLIQAWQACLDEGREPVILHFPTPKLSRIYWRSEVLHAIQSSGVTVLVCEDEACVPPDLHLPVILLDTLEAVAELGAAFEIPDAGSIIQMSSGTTGHRKAIRFQFDKLAEHVADYNRVLKLTPEDCVVSWLPLYHDMGYIAAFVMPRLIGCKLVLIDPIDWVRRPELLWEALEQHGGTVCYMPNFGFEVMSARGRPVPTMRRWISCSEPTRAATMDRFVEATGCDPSTLSNCWGMAENIFAVSQSDGISTRSIDGVDVVSCGRPIPGTTIKSVDGQLLVRSDYSLREYIGADIALDEEGFYATGDLGEVIDGEVFLLGRVKDVLNVAGRKTIASDVDFAVAEEVPESAGRICTFAIPDKDLGTDRVVVLIEHARFWLKNQDGDLMRRIASRTGLEGAQVAFVPPRFITKTSSGKVNRVTSRANWLKYEAFATGAMHDASRGPEGARSEIEARFPWIDFGRPLFEQIDSLGFVNLGIVLSRHGLGSRLRPQSVLNDLLGARSEAPDELLNVVKIVSLCDANPFRGMATPLIDSWTHLADGRPIEFKHICAPPLQVLFSDLVFHDFFMCRDDRPSAYISLSSVLEDIRQASIILVDDASTLFWPVTDELGMVYPQASHDFQTDANAPLLGVRWARYTENHHLIPYKVISATDGPVSMPETIASLSSYLGVPIVRVAWGDEYPQVTSDWEVQCHAAVKDVAARWKFDAVDQEQFRSDLRDAVEAASVRAPSRQGLGDAVPDWNDQAHFCSWLVNPAMVDFIYDHFQDCVVLGKPSSVPYLASEAERRGVRLRFRPDNVIPDDCDCAIYAGAWGAPNTDKPVFQLMGGGWGTDAFVINVPPELAAACPPNRVGPALAAPASAADAVAAPGPSA